MASGINMNPNGEPIPTGVSPRAENQPFAPPSGAAKAESHRPVEPAVVNEAFGRRAEQTAARGPDTGWQTLALGASEPIDTPGEKPENPEPVVESSTVEPTTTPATTEAAGPEAAPAASAAGEQPPIEPADAPPATGETPDHAGSPDTDVATDATGEDAEATKPPSAAKPEAEAPAEDDALEDPIGAVIAEALSKAAKQESEEARAHRVYTEAEKRGDNAEKLNKLAANISLGREKDVASAIIAAKGQGANGRLAIFRAMFSGGGNAVNEVRERNAIIGQLKKDHQRQMRQDEKGQLMTIEARSAQAKEMDKDAKRALREARKSGKEDEIQAAQANYAIAHEQFMLARSENRKKKFKNSLIGIITFMLLATFMDSMKQARGGVEQNTQPQRGHA